MWLRTKIDGERERFKLWLFGKQLPKEELKATHNQLNGVVVEHRTAVQEFQKAADDLLHKIAVEERYNRRFPKKKLDGDGRGN